MLLGLLEDRRADRDYGGMNAGRWEIKPLDFIIRWGIDHLVESSRDAQIFPRSRRRPWDATLFVQPPRELLHRRQEAYTSTTQGKTDGAPAMLEALRESVGKPPFISLT